MGGTVSDYPDALAESISELSRLLVNEEALEDTLHRVAELACRTIGSCDLAGVTLMRDGKAETAVFTDPTSPEIDADQYATGVGPCLDAYRQQRVVRIASTTEDEEWPPFSRAAAEHGVMSTISFPLATREHAIGALNLYSKSANAFGDADQEVGRLFSEQASVALANAQLYASAHRLSQQLNEALRSRAVIDQAKGILMAQNGVSADEAFRLLVGASQRSNRKLRDIAQELVDRRRKPGDR
jgi:GAF domain-containing protein